MTLRLLLVHAHPDDETLNHGATIAAALAMGHEVDLVTCTRGEEGEVIGDEHAGRTSDRDDTLDELRSTELAAALAALARPVPGAPGRPTGHDGAGAPRVTHHWLDALPGPAARYRDTGMVVVAGGRAAVPPHVRPGCFAVSDLDEVAHRLAGLVRARRPHVLATYGPHGGYGHPDHVMAHRTALRALELADPHWSVPWVYGAAGDAGRLRAWLRAHRAADGRVWDPEGDLPQMFLEAEQIDAVVRAGPWLPAKVAALRALASQVTVLDDTPGRERFALSNDVPQPLDGEEAGQLLRPVAARPGDAGALRLAPDDPLAALLLPPGTRPGHGPGADPGR